MTKKTGSKTVVFKVGRDAEDGTFIPVEEARIRHDTAIVETIRRPRYPEGGGSSKRK